MRTVALDEFADVSRWLPVASGEAELRLSEEGGALRMDFDFRGGGGFVVARREMALTLPEAFAFSFRVRGEAPPNKLEFKLADPSGKNVWRWQEEGFEFRAEGREITLRAGEIPFAWGPAGGGAIRELGAVEFAVSAPPGGRGVVWIDRFRLEDRTIASPPAASASGSAPGCAPEHVLSPDKTLVWRAAPGESRPWLQLDFHAPREYGGLVVTWDEGPEAAGSRAFAVEASDDLASWRRLYWAADDRGPRSFIPLPAGESRYLRLAFESPGGVQGVEVQPFDFAHSPEDFFHYVAARSPRGWYPRYWLREQSYWTCAGAPDGRVCALINEEGMAEPDKGGFSVEPFLEAGGRVWTWADASVSVCLKEGGLPLPSARWEAGGLELEISCFARGARDDVVVFVRYRVTNRTGAEREARLYAAIRPFQVTPPWQAWQGMGGLSRIRRLSFEGGFACADGVRIVVPLRPVAAAGAAAFEQGDIPEYVTRGRLPEAAVAEDREGYASGAMRFDLRLAAFGSAEVYLAVPQGGGADAARAAELSRMDGAAAYAEAARVWRERLGGVVFEMPEGVAREGAEAFRTAAGHILINRDGPAIQPGPRRYTRSWIRDGVMMGAALQRAGETRALREFLEWYAPYQREDGFVPCCVDRSGPDWLPEHDSHGQLVFGVREVFRFGGDRCFLEAMWPRVRLAARFIEALRNERLGPEYQTPQRLDRYGLLPESASHEGYLAHPVHSYWDDFWALRGLKDAAAIAAELGHEAEAEGFAALAEAFAADLSRSIRRVIAERKLDYVPGSVEWADFDPAATANTVALLGLGGLLPERELRQMFDRYLHDFRRKRAGEMEWANYTAYEIRIISALTRLGRREEALELARFFLDDRRPKGWNQWPEISWRDMRSPGHLGDVPHTWIASEWMLAFAGLLAFEREADGALVVGAGVDSLWLDRAGFSVRGLRTWFGPLDLAMRRESAETVLIEIGGGLSAPPGGVVIRPPTGGRAICAVEVNRRPAETFDAEEARIGALPAVVRLTLGDPAAPAARVSENHPAGDFL